MDGRSTLVDRTDVFGTGTGEVSSPFAGGGLRPMGAGGAEAEDSEDRGYGERGYGERGYREVTAPLLSPFSEGLVDTATGSASEVAFQRLLAELHDEAFEEELQRLVDEAASRYLTAAGTGWQAESWPDSGAQTEVQTWAQGLAEQADELFERLERQFGARTLDSLREGELEAAMTGLAGEGPADLGGEQLFGSLLRKIGSAVGSVAKWGLGHLADLALGPLLAIFRKAVPALLRAVLPKIVSALPESIRADVAAVAAKLGITLPGFTAAAGESASAPSTGAVLAELFDATVARAALADNPAAIDHLLSEWETIGGYGESADATALARLDAARATLARQLTEAAPGADLTTEVEQFIPAVMAALPLARTVISFVGRGKLVNLLAAPIAAVLKGQTGAAVATAISRVVADKALSLMRLEAEAPETPARFGAEALVSTVEDTVRAVGSLPPQSQADPLRVRTEVQEAFAEAAARHIPDELLRSDLDAHETEGSGVWVLMPRGAGRPRRYRRHTTVHHIAISRPMARIIVLCDGGTLEQRLLDEGVTTWPAEADVHVYEALPGTHLGHLAAGESEVSGRPVDASEFEELTAPTAGLLLNQPGLGRPPTGGVGARYYRLVLPGRPPTVRRHHKRVAVRMSVREGRPSVRVHLRLGEHEAHRVGELLAQRADIRLVAAFRSVILGMAQRSLPWRLIRQAPHVPGLALTSQQARSLAMALGEHMVTAVAAQLRALAPTLAAATRDPAPGVTFTFEFRFADPAAITAGRTEAPTVTVRPGRHHD